MTRATPSSLLLSALLLLASCPAWAGEEEAKTFFAEGRKLRDAGNCGEAVDAFKRALEAWPEGLGALRNIAECQEALGLYASARRSYYDLRRSVLQSGDTKYKGWDDFADQGYARLQTLVPKLTIRVLGADVTRLRVRIGTEDLSRNMLGVPLERDVGDHTIEVWHEGRRLAKRKVQLDASQDEVVTIEVTLPRVKRTDTHEEPSIVLEAVGYTSLGLGVLGLGGVIASAVVRQGAIDELAETCPGFDEGGESACPLASEAARDRGEIATTLFNVFGVVAIVGIGAGIPMIVVGTLDNDTEASAGLVPLPGGGMFTARLRY